MKKRTTLTGWLVMAAAFISGIIACNKVDNTIDEPATPEPPKTYTMTVTASKGDEATTRALTIEGKTMNATWMAGDVIKVMKRREMMGNYALLGTLSASTVSADGLTATFTGSFDADKVTSAGGLAEGDLLLLGYPGANLGSSTSAFVFNYNGQDGTLPTIASNYDYCMTTTSKSKMVTVASVDDGVITTTGTASFTNQQAIVRFTLTESDGTTPVCPTSLDITAVNLVQSVSLPESGGISPTPTAKTLTLTPDGSTNVIYAALRGISGQTVTLRATNDDKCFTYTTKSAATFTQGQFYDVKVKMSDGYTTVNLSSLSGDYTANDYETLTGTMPSGKHVTIPAGGHVRLSGVTISETDHAAIECLGDATFVLVGDNSVSSTSSEYAAIQAGPTNTTLTIKGSGSLTVDSLDLSAGIGSGSNATCGDITFSGGTVTATAGTDAAAIGSGRFGHCGNITITNGVTRVTANKSATNPGPYSIGKGYYNVYNPSTCGTITIGGTVYYDGTNFQNGGDTYLATSPLEYQP